VPCPKNKLPYKRTPRKTMKPLAILNSCCCITVFDLMHWLEEKRPQCSLFGCLMTNCLTAVSFENLLKGLRGNRLAFLQQCMPYLVLKLSQARRKHDIFPWICLLVWILLSYLELLYWDANGGILHELQQQFGCEIMLKNEHTFFL
jgi:hypothetical protein